MENFLIKSNIIVKLTFVLYFVIIFIKFYNENKDENVHRYKVRGVILKLLVKKKIKHVFLEYHTTTTFVLFKDYISLLNTNTSVTE